MRDVAQRCRNFAPWRRTSSWLATIPWSRAEHPAGTETAMATKSYTAAPMAALALGLLFTSPVCTIVDAIVPGTTGNFGFISPAIGQPAALTKKQSDALNTYNNAVSSFKSILGQRRAQIDSKQALPNLPGQALYLARNKMMGACKDLTDALP